MRARILTMKAAFTISLMLAAGGIIWWHQHDRPRRDDDSISCELLKTRHLAVSATINGRGPFRLIFDTGSPVVLLSSRVANEAELRGPGQRKLAKAAGAMPGQLIVPSIELGNAKAEKVPAIVFDHPTLKAIEGVTGQIDGIIGFPFFARYKTTVDYANLTIKLEKSDFQPDDVMQTMMKVMFEGKRKPATIGSAGQWGIVVTKPIDDSEPGVVISKVFAQTPASESGLREGDRLLTIDSMWTESEEDCLRAAAMVEPDRRAAVGIRRGNQNMTLQIQPREGF